MPLREHLRELRSRTLLAAGGILVAACVGWFLYTPAFAMLQRPLLRMAAQRDQLIAVNFGGVVTSLDIRFRVAVFLGLIISSPWWLYQVWAFVVPGLTRRERLTTIGYVAAAVPLFVGGCALAWFSLPRAIEALSGLTPHGAANLIDAQQYLAFVMHFVLAFGIVFVLPVLMIALNVAGLVSGRRWFSWWRWAVVICSAFAAVITPTPDAVSMLIVGGIACGLYFAAAGTCLLRERLRRGRDDPAVLPTERPREDEQGE